MKRQPVKTQDGSYTLFVPELNEHYHSTFGALQESRHVFLKMGFDEVVHLRHSPVKVLEVGFGTGLNALLTAIEGQNRNIPVDFTTIETHPLRIEELPPLSEEFNEDQQALFKKIHGLPWDSWEMVTDSFRIKKIYNTLEDTELSGTFHVIYHDAFGPDVQPSLWTAEIFKKLYKHTENEGVLVTYSAKGAVKRALRAAGYTTESLPGPPGKREITRAKRID